MKSLVSNGEKSIGYLEKVLNPGIFFVSPAQVAKLVDALVSGISVSNDVKVRVLSWAPAFFRKEVSWIWKGREVYPAEGELRSSQERSEIGKSFLGTKNTFKIGSLDLLSCGSKGNIVPNGSNS